MFDKVLNSRLALGESNALATAVAVYDTVDEFRHIDFRQSSSLKFQKYPSRVRRWYEKVLKSRLKSGDSLAAAMAMAVLKAIGHNPEVDFRRSPPRPSGRSQRKRELQYSIIPYRQSMMVMMMTISLQVALVDLLHGQVDDHKERKSFNIPSYRQSATMMTMPPQMATLLQKRVRLKRTLLCMCPLQTAVLMQ